MHLVIAAALVIGAGLVAQTEHSFHWSDAAIGAAAGFGFALAVMGAISLARMPRPPIRRRREFNR